MNPKLALVAVVGLAIVGGGVWWFSNNDTTNNNQQNTTENTFEQTSINELLSQNMDLRCSYSHADSQNTLSSGEVYMSKGRFSGDFSAKAEGETSISSHMINDGQTQYSWQDGMADGFKFELQQVDSEQIQNEDNTSGIDKDEDFNFQCEEWSVDEGRFQPPENVNFIDYTQQIEEVQNQSSEALEQACAQITDSARKAACESAL